MRNLEMLELINWGGGEWLSDLANTETCSVGGGDHSAVPWQPTSYLSTTVAYIDAKSGEVL